MTRHKIPLAIKAYEVRDPNEGDCVVVFARHNVVARREGALELGIEFDEVESCTRAPAFDQYNPGPVPLHATLAAGWWHGCCGCGISFDADGYRDGWGLKSDLACAPIADGADYCYCSPACMMQTWARRREEDARIAAAIEACAMTWPGASKIHAWEHRSGQIRTGFNVPGVPNSVTWDPGAEVVLVCTGDIRAWFAYRAAHGLRCKHLAPWPDAAGNELREGDVIRHPDGSTATIFYDDTRQESNRWRAIYDSGESLLLGLQIGDRGQALRVDPITST